VPEDEKPAILSEERKETEAAIALAAVKNAELDSLGFVWEFLPTRSQLMLSTKPLVNKDKASVISRRKEITLSELTVFSRHSPTLGKPLCSIMIKLTKKRNSILFVLARTTICSMNA
jgi:hypothetical protein